MAFSKFFAPSDDYSTIILKVFTYLEMVTILLLLLPIFNVITLSKYIRLFKVHIIKNTTLWLTVITLYAVIIADFGIVSPSRTLNNLKISSVINEHETNQEKVIRITRASNATRKYLLGAFSMFYVLVIWRLTEFIEFSAKLHEFSNLMSTYDLVDVTLQQDKEETLESLTIDIVDIEEHDNDLNGFTSIEQDNSIIWPSIADLNKQEKGRIRTFFKQRASKIKDKNKAKPRKSIFHMIFRRSKEISTDLSTEKIEQLSEKSSDIPPLSGLLTSSNNRLVNDSTHKQGTSRNSKQLNSFKTKIGGNTSKKRKSVEIKILSKENILDKTTSTDHKSDICNSQGYKLDENRSRQNNNSNKSNEPDEKSNQNNGKKISKKP